MAHGVTHPSLFLSLDSWPSIPHWPLLLNPREPYSILKCNRVNQSQFQFCVIWNIWIVVWSLECSVIVWGWHSLFYISIFPTNSISWEFMAGALVKLELVASRLYICSPWLRILKHPLEIFSLASLKFPGMDFLVSELALITECNLFATLWKGLYVHVLKSQQESGTSHTHECSFSKETTES